MGRKGAKRRGRRPNTKENNDDKNNNIEEKNKVVEEVKEDVEVKENIKQNKLVKNKKNKKDNDENSDSDDYSGLEDNDKNENDDDNTDNDSNDDGEALTNEQLKSLDKIALDVASKAKSKHLNKETKNQSAVVYLGHIPFGFFEKQIKGFFSQFGYVKNVHLSRSRRTGGSRGFAFIEFGKPEVASIVADTMNNYMMFGRSLVCNIVNEVHPDTFKTTRKFKKVPWYSMAVRQHNKTRTVEQQKKRHENLIRKDAKKRKKLAALGIDYDFDGYGKINKDKVEPPPKKIQKKSKKKKKTQK